MRTNARQVCSVLRPGDAVVAISYSGTTRDTLRSVEIAKEAGAKVVALTRFGPNAFKPAGRRRSVTRRRPKAAIARKGITLASRSFASSTRCSSAFT